MIRFITYCAVFICGLIAIFAASWLIYMPGSDARGAWRAQTGGAILHLTPLKATLYSESSHSCLQNIAFPAHMKLIELAEGASVTVIDGTLHLDVDGALDTAKFDKIAALPENCGQPDPSTADARDVFDAVWAAMDEHYAFFNLHEVDWDARKQLAPAPGTQLPDADLNDMLLKLTRGLDDGHVHFGSEDFGYDSPSQRPAWIPEGPSLTRDILHTIAADNAGTILTRAENTPILYGLRRDGIGYIMITEMDVAVPFGGNSTDAMAIAFGNVLAALEPAKALVIDIRYNPGGSDTVSFGVAGHFTDSPRPVFTKTTRMGNTQAAKFTAVLTPQGAQADTRPVVLLTSNLTGSAAEILTLALRETDHVTTLGEATSGGLSDVMGFTLPNGWGLGLSNQTYLTMGGALYEGTGIPPDITVAFETPQYLAGRDPVLAAGFAKARALIP